MHHILRSHIAWLMAGAMTCLLAACRSESTPTAESTEVLIQIGDSSLYLNDVLRKMPVGLEKEDSARLFQSIVDSWIQDMLLTRLAENTLSDPERIDRMVEEYRRQLIISEYRRKLKKSDADKISDAEVRKYYDEHADEMVLEMPLIKGVYLKMPDEAADPKIEELLSTPDKGNARRLEKSALGRALQYEHFEDRWVDWESIADQIPYRFFDPDAFVESTPDFSTSYNGATYYLHITAHLPSGEKMPLEVAATRIREILSHSRNADYEQRVINNLYKQALRDGTLKKIGYDPVARRRL